MVIWHDNWCFLCKQPLSLDLDNFKSILHHFLYQPWGSVFVTVINKLERASPKSTCMCTQRCLKRMRLAVFLVDSMKRCVSKTNFSFGWNSLITLSWHKTESLIRQKLWVKNLALAGISSMTNMNLIRHYQKHKSLDKIRHSNYSSNDHNTWYFFLFFLKLNNRPWLKIEFSWIWNKTCAWNCFSIVLKFGPIWTLKVGYTYSTRHFWN